MTTNDKIALFRTYDSFDLEISSLESQIAKLRESQSATVKAMLDAGVKATQWRGRIVTPCVRERNGKVAYYLRGPNENRRSVEILHDEAE